LTSVFVLVLCHWMIDTCECSSTVSWNDWHVWMFQYCVMEWLTTCCCCWLTRVNIPVSSILQEGWLNMTFHQAGVREPGTLTFDTMPLMFNRDAIIGLQLIILHYPLYQTHRSAFDYRLRSIISLLRSSFLHS